MPNQVSIRKPSKVTLAQGRLEDATVWLENVVNLKNDILNEPSQTVKIDTLKKEIKQLKKENIVLKKINDQISSRLDVVIKRLRTAIGG